ncbi:MAG TPA: NADH-quinone oxidoreductase subunit M, partial [Pedobacter sp.]
MEILLLIFLPILGAILTSLVGKSQHAKTLALIWSLLSFALTAYLLVNFNSGSAAFQYNVDYPWLNSYGIRFKAGIDGISMMMVLLINLLMPLIILSSFKHHYKKPGAFY